MSSRLGAVRARAAASPGCAPCVLDAHVGVSVRTLQRLCRDRLGLTPKWLIQRRRLHDAALRLKSGPVDLATLAAELGYADQARFTNDWTTVTGTSPGAYAADQPRP